jgi:hypothetical protein
MKNLMLSFTVMAVFGFVLGACGDSTQGGGKTDCEKYAELAAETMDAACATKSDACCVCKCWKEDQDYDPMAVDCTCVPFDAPLETCEGALLQEAQECLADESACKTGIRNGVEVLCQQS